VTARRPDATCPVSPACARPRVGGTIDVVDDPEAMQLVLETLFVIRADVRDIHRAIFMGGDDEEEEDES
jgi:hypothetical protein